MINVFVAALIAIGAFLWVAALLLLEIWSDRRHHDRGVADMTLYRPPYQRPSVADEAEGWLQQQGPPPPSRPSSTLPR